MPVWALLSSLHQNIITITKVVNNLEDHRRKDSYMNRNINNSFIRGVNSILTENSTLEIDALNRIACKTLRHHLK